MALGLRLYARSIKNKSLQLNDYLAIAACILATANGITTILAVYLGGVGIHQQFVLAEAETLGKITFALALLWTFANTCVKLSALHLYITIFRTKSFRYATYGVMGLSIAYCLVNFLQLLLICQPVAYNWDKTIPGGHCLTAEAPFLSSAIINMTVDIIIVALPMPVLWSLQMALSKKISISIIFGIGISICALSAVRISSISNLDYLDFSYSVVPDGIYSVLEPYLGVINSSLPVLQPVASKIASSATVSKLRGSLLRNKSSKASDGSGKISNGGANRFQRLADNSLARDPEVYPLTKVLTNQDQAKNHRIAVTREWTVREQDAREKRSPCERGW